jgi:hypothetical protein
MMVSSSARYRRGSEATSILYETLGLVGDTQPENELVVCCNLLMRDL